MNLNRKGTQICVHQGIRSLLLSSSFFCTSYYCCSLRCSWGSRIKDIDGVDRRRKQVDASGGKSIGKIWRGMCMKRKDIVEITVYHEDKAQV